MYALAALAMLIYGVPRIELTSGLTWQNAFGAVWIAFALLVIAAQLHWLFRVDESKERQMKRVKRAKYASLERTMERVVEKSFNR